jgi:hypothetical protein
MLKRVFHDLVVIAFSGREKGEKAINFIQLPMSRGSHDTPIIAFTGRQNTKGALWDCIYS